MNRILRYCSYGLLPLVAMVASPVCGTNYVIDAGDVGGAATLRSNDPTVGLYSDTLVVNGSIEAAPAVTMEEGTSVANNGQLISPGIVIQGINATVPYGTESITNTGTISNIAGGFPVAVDLGILAHGVTFNNSGTIVGSVHLPRASTMNVSGNASGAWGVAGASIAVNIGGNNVSITTPVDATVFIGLDSINVTSGIFTLNGLEGVNVTNTISNINAFNISNGAVANLGTATASIAISGVGGLVNAGTMNLFNAQVTGGNVIENNGSMTIAGISAAPARISSNNFNNNGLLTVGTNVTFDGVMNMGAGATVMGGITPTTGPGLNLNFNITQNFATNGPISASRIAVFSPAQFTVNDTVIATDNFTFNPGTTLTVNTTSPLYIDGTATITNSTIGNIGTTFGNPLTLNINQNCSTNGPITATDIMINSPANFTMNNPVTGNLVFANGTTFTSNSNTATMSGSVGITGGTIQGDIATTAAKALTLNINQDTTNNGTIAATNMVVNSPATFTLNNAISVNTLAGFAGTGSLMNKGIVSVVSPQTLTGSIINSGTASLTQNLNGVVNYTQNRSGVFQTTLHSTSAPFGRLLATGTVTLDGAVEILLPDNGIQINNGDTFTVLTTTAVGRLTDTSTLLFPPSSVLSFTKGLDGTNSNLILTAQRKTYCDLNKIRAYDGISAALDDFRRTGGEAEIMALLEAIDSQPTMTAVQNALAQLTPAVNGGAIESSFTAQNLFLDKIENRLMVARAGVDLGRTGYSAGDMASGQGSYGPMVFGSTSRQQTRNNIAGYTSFTGGFGFLGDVPITSHLKLGAAISYAGTSVKSANPTNAANNTTAITSVQGTIYSSIDYHPFFLDTMLGLAGNRYTNKRVIALTNQTATGKFGGAQYTGKVRGGFVLFRVHGIEAAPLASLQYTQLDQNGYTETGAPGANLGVDKQSSKFVQMGLGIRIADTREAEEFYPEIHAMVLNDIKRPTVQVVSKFIQGGIPFTTGGPAAAKQGVNIGASLTMLILQDFLVTGGYDLESRKSFMSHSASLKCRWVF